MAAYSKLSLDPAPHSPEGQEVSCWYIDQPSSKFTSFGDPRISEVGAQLDAKVAELLRLMSLPVPPELTAI